MRRTIAESKDGENVVEGQGFFYVQDYGKSVETTTIC